MALPEGFQYVAQGAPGAQPVVLGGHTFYMAPVQAAGTAAKPTATPSYNPNAGSYGMGTTTVPGVGQVPVYTARDGSQYYYQGGSRFNLTQAQLNQMGLPTLANIKASGPGGKNIWTWNQPVPPQPAAPKPNPSAPLPETNALADIKKIDPISEAMRARYGAETADLQQRATAGTLPPGVLREIQQDVRNTQAGTGNTAGVAQAAQEAMTTGSAGLNYLNNVRGQVLGYLGSGQTPYSVGAQYTDRALNQQNAAATGQMVPSYNPYSQGNTPPPFTSIDPQAGNQFAQGTTQFMNQGVGATVGKPASGTGGALIGAAGGIGAAAITAAGGALFCQAARVIYGDATPEQLMFRDWILFKAPDWLRVLYAKYAERFGKWVKDKPIARAITKYLMDLAIRNANQKSTAPGITEAPEFALG